MLGECVGVKEDLSITHDDGRVVGFAEYGHPDGFPTVFFHGTPGSRIGGRLCHRWAEEAGCRLIALDRPGFGESSFQEGRKMTDHVGDVTAVCDKIGVGRFAVAGASGGTPYVFACAAALPERVTAGAIVSGFFGMDPPVDPAELAPEVRAQFEQYREDPEASRPTYDGSVAMFRTIEPQAFMTQAMAESPEWIRELVASDHWYAEAFIAHHIEGLKSGSDGGVQEIGLNVGPWGIDLGSVTQEIRMWHGGKDPVPRSHLDAVAAELRSASVSWHDDCGHLDCVFLMPEVFAWLASTF